MILTLMAHKTKTFDFAKVSHLIRAGSAFTKRRSTGTAGSAAGDSVGVE